MKIGIISLGLIGGCMALSLPKTDFWKKINRIQQIPKNASLELKIEIVDEIVSPNTLITQSELIILATPVNGIRKISPELLNAPSDKSVVLDIGSTKENICQAIAKHSKRNRFISTHPIYGTEYSGLKTPFYEVFERKKIIFQSNSILPRPLKNRNNIC
ncbi:MAG: prephenate dehydrogenase/arogenate dehydrogenase family protein [Flavobacteriales bacterium Tduv]